MPDPAVVLVTGTSRGIGSHLARHFLDRDWTVIGCSRHGDPGIDRGRYVHHVVDVGSEADVLQLFRAIRTDHGRLDAVVNNAAINPTLGLVAMTSAAAASATLATNVLGPLLVCREAVKLMMRRRYGRVVNIGSMATRHEVEGESLYTASKAAVNALTRVLAKEVAPYGITCNVVAPAAVEEGLSRTVNPAKLQEILGRNAIAEPGTAEDVAATVEWLLRPESSAITGQIVYLGGA